VFKNELYILFTSSVLKMLDQDSHQSHPFLLELCLYYRWQVRSMKLLSMLFSHSSLTSSFQIQIFSCTSFSNTLNLLPCFTATEKYETHITFGQNHNSCILFFTVPNNLHAVIPQNTWIFITLLITSQLDSQLLCRTFDFCKRFPGVIMH
jgi:hypothetical protein